MWKNDTSGEADISFANLACVQMHAHQSAGERGGPSSGNANSGLRAGHDGD